MENESFVVKTINPGQSQTQLLLEGQLVIRNAALIKKELLSALTNSQTLELILKDITKVDMAFLQLLVALHKSAAIAGKRISLDIEPTAYMKSVVENSGLQNHLTINSSLS